MAKAKRRDPKSEPLAQDGVLNPNPESVRDALFATNPFFDAKDLVQVRYEMVRRHQVDGVAISEAAATFGVTRPTFYKAQSALQTDGLAGLLPRRRGPKGGHKMSSEVVAFVTDLKAASPETTTSQCLDAIAARFGVKVHRRSLERALARKKKESIQPDGRAGEHSGHLREAARRRAVSRTHRESQSWHSSPLRLGSMDAGTRSATSC
jgi:transposase